MLPDRWRRARPTIRRRCRRPFIIFAIAAPFDAEVCCRFYMLCAVNLMFEVRAFDLSAQRVRFCLHVHHVENFAALFPMSPDAVDAHRHQPTTPAEFTPHAAAIWFLSAQTPRYRYRRVYVRHDEPSKRLLAAPPHPPMLRHANDV